MDPFSASPSDEELAALAQAGSAEAMIRLEDRFRGRLGQTIQGLTGTSWQASDLLEKVFSKIRNCLPLYRGKSRFFGWAHQIAVLLTINHLRKKRRPPPVSAESFPELPWKPGRN